MRRVRVGAAVAVLLLTAGGIVAAVNTDDGRDKSRRAGVPVDTDEALLEAPAALSTGGGASRVAASTADRGAVRSAPAPSDPNGPRIVKRADIRVEVAADGFRAAFQRASAVASAHGGFVAESTSRTEDGDDSRSASGTLVLRVPATAFDAARAELADLGEVHGEVIEGEDVGGQLVDLDARIRSLQVEEETLRTLMARAKTVGETIEVQRELTRVRQEIEQAAGQRARLQDAAALATIRLNLFEPGATPAEQPGDPNPVAEGARDAVDAALAVIGGTLVVLGYVVPLALLALLGWALWRVLARRRPAPVPST